jgi:excisionase family DNA binding protein
VEIKMDTKDLVSVAQAAKELSKPRYTLYRWVNANKMIGVRLGGILFIPISEVERMKKELETEPAGILVSGEDSPQIAMQE